jgi:hypothetical protein
MLKKLLTGLVVIIALLVVYLLTRPVAIDPKAWEAPPMVMLLPLMTPARSPKTFRTQILWCHSIPV